MGQRIDHDELRRRAIGGVREEVVAFGGGALDSSLIRRDGLIASVAPAAPQRSLFNSVFYEDPATLAKEIGPLGEVYSSRGIRAWTVWVPDDDRDTAQLLAERGHKLDAAPRAMALNLAELPEEPRAPEGIRLAPCTTPLAAELNDRAYGYGPDGFRSALVEECGLHWHGAYAGEEPVSCVGSIEVGDDCCVTGVATPSEWQGRGIASWLLWRVLAEAREGGFSTASLQATRAGAPIYERLGFADFGFIEMWELRR
ncbi:MAG TPA: GNAT family N-acetyltransferase [Solirubrobacterales bacterium]|jgi:GNAT superfamily N-acetyltransferase